MTNNSRQLPARIFYTTWPQSHQVIIQNMRDDGFKFMRATHREAHGYVLCPEPMTSYQFWRRTAMNNTPAVNQNADNYRWED